MHGQSSVIDHSHTALSPSQIDILMTSAVNRSRDDRNYHRSVACLRERKKINNATNLNQLARKLDIIASLVTLFVFTLIFLVLSPTVNCLMND